MFVGVPAKGKVDGMVFRDEGVRVGPSPNGLGVFSVRSFGQREMLGPIQGTVLDDPLYESNYCMELGDYSVLEPSAPFRYMNHSCHPNCALVELEIEHEDGSISPPGAVGRNPHRHCRRRADDHRLCLARRRGGAVSLRMPRLPWLDRGRGRAGSGRLHEKDTGEG